MKKLYLTVTLLCFGYFLNAQTLGYNDVGVLFSKENINGTARYNAMSGAFGALGGDLSAMEINPAGAAVFLKSEFAVSLNIRNTKTTSDFYGNSLATENEYTNLSQAGGVFVFRDYGNNSAWSNIALGFNYNIANDFENLWIAEGNSGYAPLTDFYDPIPAVYGNAENQYFENLTDGKNNKYSFTIAAQHNDNLYLGASINTYDVEYSQRTLTEEYNNDGNNNTLDVSSRQELLTYGNGVSFNFGVISKPSENLRLGLAYQSPVWYTLSEDFLEYDENVYNNDVLISNEYSGLNSFDYKLRTPSKFTGSFAYIFSTNGLVSVDYSLKNYSNIELSNANFSTENQAFKNDLENVGELRIGTEWRFDNLSVRGGYHFENSPYKNSLSSDNLEGFSLGAGYKFRGVKLDFAYQKTTKTAPYNFYPQSNDVNSAELDIDTSKFTATLVLNI
ncbi:MAG: outer membrane protein transport protein [Flavobacteriaceae bacterium]|nr:outer membrane protein transport protein [Flavobacteriaceae bacterium]